MTSKLGNLLHDMQNKMLQDSPGLVYGALSHFEF